MVCLKDSHQNFSKAKIIDFLLKNLKINLVLQKIFNFTGTKFSYYEQKSNSIGHFGICFFGSFSMELY